MNLFFVYQRHLNNLNETKFIIKWDKFVRQYMRKFMVLIFIAWLILNFAFAFFIFDVTGFFFGFVFTIIFSIYLGYVLLVQSIKFLTFNSDRYIKAKIYQENNIVDGESVFVNDEDYKFEDEIIYKNEIEYVDDKE